MDINAGKRINAFATTDNLDRLPVTVLKGVGARVAGRLERLGLRTVQDVLFHLPLRYQDRTRLVAIGSLRLGQEAVICGEIQITQVHYGRRRSLIDVKRERIPLRAEFDDLLGGQLVVLGLLPRIADLDILKVLHSDVLLDDLSEPWNRAFDVLSGGPAQLSIRAFVGTVL